MLISMSHRKEIKNDDRKIGNAAMLEQMAEEASELTKAALKTARILRKENPTPVKLEDAILNLFEEYTDVVQCAMELHIIPDQEQIQRKAARFEKRWEDMQNGKKTI